jgi:signal transduction histidine kinase
MRQPIGLLALAATYFVVARLGLLMASIHASASPVWPATGLALAAVLVLGTRAWPAIFLGALLANATNAGSLATSLGIATGNTLEAVVGAELVRRFAGGRGAFDHAQRAVHFAAVGLPSTALSAGVGVASLCAGGFASWSQFGPIALTWWLGDYGGFLVVAPLLVLLAAPSGIAWTRARVLEGVAIAATVALVSGWVFGSQFPLPGRHYPLSFVCVPPALWAAFRFQRHGAAVAVVLATALADWGTSRGIGPFSVFDRNQGLLLTQAFMCVLGVASLVLAGAMFERLRIERALRAAYHGLGLRFREKRFDLARTVKALHQAQSEILQVNAELEERVQVRTRELERSNQELERFASVAAHDLYEPLRTVTWYTRMLAERLNGQGTPEIRGMVERIQQGTGWMGSTIDALLEYSRVSAARPRLARVATGAALERAWHNLAHRVLESGAMLDHGSLPEVDCDERLLVRLFQNLIENAIKFHGDRPPHIEVTARRLDHGWEFALRDRGVGIPEPELERVFGLFHRLDSRDETPGAGIGLATCRRILECHGGRIWASSRPGSGCTISFTLPDAPAEPVESERGVVSARES